VLGCGTGTMTKFPKFGLDFRVSGFELNNINLGSFEGVSTCFNINFLENVPPSVFVFNDASSGRGQDRAIAPLFIDGGLNSSGPSVCCGDLYSCCGFYQYTNSCYAGTFSRNIAVKTIVFALLNSVLNIFETVIATDIASSLFPDDAISSIVEKEIDIGLESAISSYISFNLNRYGYYKLFYLKNSKTIQLYLSNLPSGDKILGFGLPTFVSGTSNLVLDGAYDCCEVGRGGRRYTGALNAEGIQLKVGVGAGDDGFAPNQFAGTGIDINTLYFGTLTLNIDIPGLNTCN
jgi:hypothetical protein